MSRTHRLQIPLQTALPAISPPRPPNHDSLSSRSSHPHKHARRAVGGCLASSTCMPRPTPSPAVDIRDLAHPDKFLLCGTGFWLRLLQENDSQPASVATSTTSTTTTSRPPSAAARPTAHLRRCIHHASALRHRARSLLKTHSIRRHIIISNRSRVQRQHSPHMRLKTLDNARTQDSRPHNSGHRRIPALGSSRPQIRPLASKTAVSTAQGESAEPHARVAWERDESEIQWDAERGKRGRSKVVWENELELMRVVGCGWCWLASCRDLLHREYSVDWPSRNSLPDARTRYPSGPKQILLTPVGTSASVLCPFHTRHGDERVFPHYQRKPARRLRGDPATHTEGAGWVSSFLLLSFTWCLYAFLRTYSVPSYFLLPYSCAAFLIFFLY
ncbi:hypothetical protein C8J57DRAFT_1485539 [Mycena rebaudengoi]|nr:hypothetical protein C8J57DRAFT_1485539 [Mycena rebaudengoi]